MSDQTPTLPPTKRGATANFPCVYKELNPDTGTREPVSVADMTIQSQLRTARGDLIASMVVTKAADQVANKGQFVLVPDQPDTTLWPLGNHEMDIMYERDGVRLPTDTYIVPVIKGPTQWQA